MIFKCFPTKGRTKLNQLFLAVSQNGQDLRRRDQFKPPLQTLAKTLTPTNPTQLVAKISCRHLNANSDKKQRKMTSFREKIWLQTLLMVTFWELDLSCSSIFYQVWTHIGLFKANKMNFHPTSPLFSPPGWLPNTTTTPWKWFLRVP